MEEDPLWSSGQDTRLPNGRTRVRIRGSANAFEPKRIRDHEPSTPGESCGSEMRCKDLDRQPQFTLV